MILYSWQMYVCSPPLPLPFPQWLSVHQHPLHVGIIYTFNMAISRYGLVLMDAVL